VDAGTLLFWLGVGDIIAGHREIVVAGDPLQTLDIRLRCQDRRGRSILRVVGFTRRCRDWLGHLLGRPLGRFLLLDGCRRWRARRRCKQP
jgi:hypothetical protein